MKRCEITYRVEYKFRSSTFDDPLDLHSIHATEQEAAKRVSNLKPLPHISDIKLYKCVIKFVELPI